MVRGESLTRHAQDVGARAANKTEQAAARIPICDCSDLWTSTASSANKGEASLQNPTRGLGLYIPLSPDAVYKIFVRRITVCPPFVSRTAAPYLVLFVRRRYEAFPCSIQLRNGLVSLEVPWRLRLYHENVFLGVTKSWCSLTRIL